MAACAEGAATTVGGNGVGGSTDFGVSLGLNEFVGFGIGIEGAEGGIDVVDDAAAVSPIDDEDEGLLLEKVAV